MDIVAVALSLDAIKDQNELLQTLSDLAKHLHKNDTIVSDSENYRLIGALSQNYLMENENFNIKMVVLCCYMELMVKFSGADPFSSDDYKREVLLLFSSVVNNHVKMTGKTIKRKEFLISTFDKIKAFDLFLTQEAETIETFIKSLINYAAENLFSIKIDNIMSIILAFFENFTDNENILPIVFESMIKTHNSNSSHTPIIESFLTTFLPKHQNRVLNKISELIFSFDPETNHKNSISEMLTCCKLLYVMHDNLPNVFETMNKVFKFSRVWPGELRINYYKIYTQYMTNMISNDREKCDILFDVFCELAMDNSPIIKSFFGVNYLKIITEFKLYEEKHLKSIQLLLQDKKSRVRKEMILFLLDTIISNIDACGVDSLIECSLISLVDTNHGICSIALESLSQLYCQNQLRKTKGKEIFKKFEKIFLYLLNSPIQTRNLVIKHFYKYFLNVFEDDQKIFFENLEEKFKLMNNNGMQQNLFQILGESRILNIRLQKFLQSESPDCDASIYSKKQIALLFDKSEQIFKIVDTLFHKYKEKDPIGNKFMQLLTSNRGIAGTKYLVKDLENDFNSEYPHLSKYFERFLDRISLRLFYDSKRMYNFMAYFDEKVQQLIANDQMEEVKILCDLITVCAKNFPELYFSPEVLRIMITWFAENSNYELKSTVLRILSHCVKSEHNEKEIIQITGMVKLYLKSQTGKFFKQCLTCLHSINSNEYISIIKRSINKVMKSDICFKDGIFINHFLKIYDINDDPEILSVLDVFIPEKCLEMHNYLIEDISAKLPKLEADEEFPVEKIILDIKIVTNYVLKRKNVQTKIIDYIILFIQTIFRMEAEKYEHKARQAMKFCCCTQHLKIANHSTLKSFIEPNHEFEFFKVCLNLESENILKISSTICQNVQKFSLSMIYSAMVVCLSVFNPKIAKIYSKNVEDIRNILEILNLDMEKRNILQPENIIMYVAFILIEYKNAFECFNDENLRQEIIKQALTPLASGKNYYHSYNIITTLEVCTTKSLTGDNDENINRVSELNDICRDFHKSLNEMVRIDNIILPEKKKNIPISKKYFAWRSLK